MRGFYNTRLHILFMGDQGYITRDVVEFGAPLSDDEIAAATREGCAGCAWWERTVNATGSCHHIAAKHASTTEDHWCSEWRQKPAADAGGGNQ